MDSIRRGGPCDARARLGRLTEVLEGIVGTAEARCRARCPHRGVRSRCTHAEACVNQVRVPGGMRVCGGDAPLRFQALMDTLADPGP